jgi:hypothetical protein
VTPRFRTLLLTALKEFAERGYTSEADLQDWLLRLHAALEQELPSDEHMRKELAAALEAVFKREVDRTGLQRRVPGVDRYTIDRIAPSLRAELGRRIFAGVDLIKLNKAAATQKTLQRFSGWVSSVPRGGSAETNLRAAARDITKPTAELKYQRRRVAIDQGHKLGAAVAHVVAMGQGAIAGIWHDRGEKDHGYDARPAHLARSGKLFLVNDSWALNEGLIKKSGVQYTDEIEQPAELPFCFPGDTRIPFADGVRIGYRRWYCGEMTELVTASGKTLRATPNHPVLTLKGWVACGALQEGDDLVELVEQRIDGVEAKPDNHEAQPTIADIFGTLRKGRIAFRIGGRREQFHGDGTESNVDIVNAARPLSFDFVTARSKRGNQLELAVAHLRRATLRAFHFLGNAGTRFAASNMGGLNAALAPCGSAVLQLDAYGLAHGTNRSAGVDDSVPDRPAIHAKFGGERLDGLAGFVAPTKIVSVKRSNFAGHVYNLQTATGYYVAAGIVAHNCSCWYEYVTSPRNLPSDLLTAKGKAWLEGRTLSLVRNDAASAAQIHAGNYRKGHVHVYGLEVSIETSKGDVRRGVDAHGDPWSVTMPADYGYIRRTTGADDEQIDCYLGPEAFSEPADLIWVIKQNDLETSAFDEDKVMIGFGSFQEAMDTYERAFSDGRGCYRIGDVVAMTVDEFKRKIGHAGAA